MPDRPPGARAVKAPVRRAVLAAVVAVAGPAGAQTPAEAFVRRAEEGLRAARALPDRPARESRCAALMTEMFDSDALAESTAGAGWPALPPPQRAALVEAVGTRLRRECRALMARPDPGSPSILRIRESGGLLRVTTQLPATDGTGSVLVWALAPGGAWGMQARDLVSDGRSVAGLLRGEFEGALAARGGDPAAAIADLGRGR